MSFLKQLFNRRVIIPLDLQIKKTWSTLLNQYDDVPVDYKPFYESFIQQNSPFPFSIFTPSYDVFSSQSTEKLVCLTEDDIYFVNKKETLDEALRLPFNNIQYIQFKTVLLDSTLTLSGINKKGEYICAEVRFNTVSDSLFKMVVNIIRQKSFSGSMVKEPFSFEGFRAENYKFANFAQHCLLPGEKVIQLIWQPEMLQSLLHLHNALFSYSFFRRRVFPNHVLMLTDQELILISEDNQYSHIDRYGGIWDYIPLEKIQQVTHRQDQDGLITLSIELSDDQRIESRYLPTMRSELVTLVDAINKNIGSK